MGANFPAVVRLLAPRPGRGGAHPRRRLLHQHRRRGRRSAGGRVPDPAALRVRRPARRRDRSSIWAAPRSSGAWRRRRPGAARRCRSAPWPGGARCSRRRCAPTSRPGTPSTTAASARARYAKYRKLNAAHSVVYRRQGFYGQVTVSPDAERDCTSSTTARPTPRPTPTTASRSTCSGTCRCSSIRGRSAWSTSASAAASRSAPSRPIRSRREIVRSSSIRWSSRRRAPGSATPTGTPSTIRACGWSSTTGGASSSADQRQVRRRSSASRRTSGCRASRACSPTEFYRAVKAPPAARRHPLPVAAALRAGRGGLRHRARHDRHAVQAPRRLDERLGGDPAGIGPAAADGSGAAGGDAAGGGRRGPRAGRRRALGHRRLRLQSRHDRVDASRHPAESATTLNVDDRPVLEFQSARNLYGLNKPGAERAWIGRDCNGHADAGRASRRRGALALGEPVFDQTVGVVGEAAAVEHGAVAQQQQAGQVGQRVALGEGAVAVEVDGRLRVLAGEEALRPRPSLPGSRRGRRARGRPTSRRCGCCARRRPDSAATSPRTARRWWCRWRRRRR